MKEQEQDKEAMTPEQMEILRRLDELNTRLENM